MAILDVKKIPDPVLRRETQPIEEFDEKLEQLIEDMVDTMRDEPGVGLAATQIGLSQKLIVVEFGDENDPDKPEKLYAVVNPELVEISEEVEVGVEGCLSIPGMVGEVERPVAVVVKGKNAKGRSIKIKAHGWLARIFQHEIDHLDGVLFTDRATRVWQPAPDEEVISG
jgi:peptide deformylase